jgi:pre-mRNA 3'-end-processing factor FIP1
MPEDQLSALPMEVRQMVMTGATAMMSGGGPNPGMMGAINPMMDMSGMMGSMGMGGMNGDMGMQMQPGGPMIHEGSTGSGQVVGTSEQMGIPDVMGTGGPGPGMMGMGMGGEFSMQVHIILIA